MDGKTVLIIEDAEQIRAMLAGALEKEGFSVLQAGTGQEGKEMVSNLKPDLVLLDIILPGEDGCALLGQLKSNPDTRGIPVMVLSNLADQETKQKCLAGGAIDYLVKADYRLEQMVEKIKGFCCGYFQKK